MNEVRDYAYNEIVKTVLENGGKPVILSLGDLAFSNELKKTFTNRDQIEFAEADSLLNDYLLISPTKQYDKEFEIWRFNGKDSVKVDGHPNPKAHQIIANSIILKLK